MVIADFGSGNTCHNDLDYVRRMIDELAAVDPQRKVVIKFQLFSSSNERTKHCLALDWDVFNAAFVYASAAGYRVTASVFDELSLQRLLFHYGVPFIKIAAREWAYPLIERVPRGVKVIVSVERMSIAYKYLLRENVDIMCCVADYPAKKDEYEARFTGEMLRRGISDHTPDLSLWRKYKPAIYERHFKLPDSTGLDAGDFASEPTAWKEVLA